MMSDQLCLIQKTVIQHTVIKTCHDLRATDKSSLVVLVQARVHGHMNMPQFTLIYIYFT